MAIHSKYYSVQNTPNTVSADRSPGERSFVGVVAQSGKPPIDYEFNLQQDVRDFLLQAVQRRTIPSGWFKGKKRKDGYDDFSFDLSTDPSFIANSFRMNKQTAMVAGFPVTVEFTNTTTPGDNRIQLDAPPTLGGASPDVKRTDFVFLEVWLALVAPSPRAMATVTVASLPTAGDLITINGNPLTAVVGAPGVDEFTIGVDTNSTATNIATAVNLGSNSFLTDVSAYVDPDSPSVVVLVAQTPGIVGNSLTLASSSGLVLLISGALFVGGADRPNKPDQESLYRHGNVDSPSGVNLTDDLADPIILFETAQRVQVQYRIRVTGQAEAVNFKTQPDGFSNPNILAQGAQSSPVANYFFVPADNSTINGNSDATAYGYIDPGLWVAGDGSEAAATALQTLDGHVYAIPLGEVFRRNDAYLGGAGAGFDPINNTNGGLPSTHGGHANPFVGAIVAGTSDRPDGALVDVINANDFMDLRRHISPMGHDFQSELQFQIKSLMDGNFRTWAVDTADKQTLGSGSGDVSTRYLVCNEIGRSASSGGNNSTSGDTGRGVTVRNFDHLARRFGAQSVVERVVFEVYSQDRDSGPVIAPGRVNPGKYVVKAGAAPGNAGWFEGDQIHINLNSLNASTDGTFDPATASLAALLENILDFAPSGTIITDVLSIYHDDGNWNGAVDQKLYPTTIQGLGTGYVIITLDENPTSVTGGLDVAAYPLVGDVGAGDVGSPRRVFVELEITYPKGLGLTDTPDYTLTPDAVNFDFGPLLENDVSQRPADMEAPLAPNFRSGFREVSLEYIASENGAGSPIGGTTTEQFVSRDTTSIAFLRRVYGSNSLLVNVTDAETSTPVAINTSTTEYGSSSRLVKLGAGLSGAQTLCTVTYYAQDPLPNYGGAGGGYQVSVYYRSNAPQTAGVKDGVIHGGAGPLPTTLLVQPLLMSEGLWTGHTGVGSPDLAFPYAVPLDQIPVNDNSTGTFPGEWYFCATSQISIDDFNAQTGLLKLPTLVPSDETEVLSFGGALNPPTKDIEFRAFYGFADDTAYRPTIMSQPLSGAVRHKVFTPFLARAMEDTRLYRKNEILLVVLSRWAELDDENTVRFVDTDNRTCAAVYRTKNLLLLTGDEI